MKLIVHLLVGIILAITRCSAKSFEAALANYYSQHELYIRHPVVVQFLPSLVQASVLENATATNQNYILITRIRANVSLVAPLLSLYSIGNQNSSIQLQQRSHIQHQLLNNLTPYRQQSPITTVIEYHLLNHQSSFAVVKDTGEILLRQSLTSYTNVIIDVKVDINVTTTSDYFDIFQPSSKPPAPVTFHYSTKVPVSIEVIDVNNNEPESVKNLLSCTAYDNIDTQTPICTAPFKDADRGINSELVFSILSDDDSEGKTNNLIIDSKTGSIFRRDAKRRLVPGDYNEVILATDGGDPYLETSIKARFHIIDSNATINKRGLNEKPYFLESSKLVAPITLTGTESTGETVTNLTPLDPDSDIPTVHIVNGDPNSIFAIDDGSLILAKSMNFSERKVFNLTLMVTDGAEKTYLNMTVIAPKLVRQMPCKFFNVSASMSNNLQAEEGSTLIDLSRFAFDTGTAKYKLYSSSSYPASILISVDEYSGIVSVTKSFNYKFNGHHILLFSIEDNRLPPDYYRSFVELSVNVNLMVPSPPLPPPTTTTTTPKPTTTTTTTTTPPSTTTTTTTTTTTPRPSIVPGSTNIAFVPSRPPFVMPSSTNQLIPIFVPPHGVQISTSTPPSSVNTHIPYQPNHISETETPTYEMPIYEQKHPWPLPPAVHYPTTDQPVPPYQGIYPPPLLPPPPILPPPPSLPPRSMNPGFLPSPGTTIDVKTLARIVIGIMASLFFLACSCLLCRCCCRSSRSSRYRDKNGALLHRSSFHSQQRLHSHHSQSPHTVINGSISRNMNSRLSLRTAGLATPSSARGLPLKYGAGDSVSLSAMNERSKPKPALPPPSPIGTQTSVVTNEPDDNLYANAYGPGHPQYLNELRRLKPEFARMSARLPSKRPPPSEAPSSSSESRFKTFVKPKKNKNLLMQANKTSRNERHIPTASEDTDSDPTANLLNNHYDDAKLVQTSRSSMARESNNNTTNHNHHRTNGEVSQHLSSELETTQQMQTEEEEEDFEGQYRNESDDDGVRDGDDEEDAIDNTDDEEEDSADEAEEGVYELKR